MLDNLTVGSF